MNDLPGNTYAGVIEPFTPAVFEHFRTEHFLRHNLAVDRITVSPNVVTFLKTSHNWPKLIDCSLNLREIERGQLGRILGIDIFEDKEIKTTGGLGIIKMQNFRMDRTLIIALMEGVER